MIPGDNHEESKESRGVWPLSQLKAGATGRVVKLSSKGSLRRRILDMGLTPGVEIRVHGVAPLGDPIEITVRGYHLSLRKEEASGVMVEVQEL